MTNPIEPPNIAGDDRPRFDPYTGKPLDAAKPEPEPQAGANFWAQQRQAAEAKGAPEAAPVNPYAPTGWQSKDRVEFDITLPSGQLARVMRLEREDLFRLNLMGYLDTFTPMLMEETVSAEERSKRIREKMSTDPNAMANMFMAIDEVVMSATVRPRVTDDKALVDYGNPEDWSNPRFIATAYINDISMDDRFAIFASAFGRSMDDLKSVREQASGVAGVADEPGVQQAAE